MNYGDFKPEVHAKRDGMGAAARSSIVIRAKRAGESTMPFIDVHSQKTGEPLPGWHDRYFASQSMSFAYYDVDAGAAIHAHSHDEEEVWHIVEGTLEITIDGETRIAGAGTAAVVPPNSVHAVKARTNARVIIANHPTRERIVRHKSQAEA